MIVLKLTQITTYHGEGRTTVVVEAAETLSGGIKKTVGTYELELEGTFGGGSDTETITAAAHQKLSNAGLI